MTHLIVALLQLLVAPAAAERLRAQAPTDRHMTIDQAREHLASAAVAQLITGERAHTLLAIARGESEYTVDAFFRERSGALSCGVVQATARDQAHCDLMRRDLLEGYLVGAELLRSWRLSPRCRGSSACALAGYAGGWAMVEACSHPATAGACWRAVGARLRLAEVISGS